jgi:hypothetical protein
MDWQICITRAEPPIVSVVGNHATYHTQHDAPLASDVAAFARPVSGWIQSSPRPLTVAAAALTVRSWFDCSIYDFTLDWVKLAER